MKLLFIILSAVLAASAQDVNVTPSPDSSHVAFTRGGDLWLRNTASGKELRVTDDASDDISSGYASWVYYEEIFGRQSKFKAFWWSPDGRKLAFYRFDNSGIGTFPIFSPFGQYGSLNNTRYPKAGGPNPKVRLAFTDLEGNVVWADFKDDPQQYFGTPFWGDDSRSLYVQWMPRRQNHLELFKVDSVDGSKASVYEENYPTWVGWMDEMLFGKDGLYMVRSFETGWEQIYYLSYDGKTLKRLTEGTNRSTHLLKLDEKKGDIWFISNRDSPLHPTLYRLDKKGGVTALTNPEYWTNEVKFSPDGKTFTANCSNARTPWHKVEGSSFKGVASAVDGPQQTDEGPSPQIVMIENGVFALYGLISYPKGFDAGSGLKYPVVMMLYGGPGTAYVRDFWQNRDASDRWCWENGIIYIVVDPRSSGENGRKGLDEAFGRMTVIELDDYLAWAKWLKGLGYVSKIGVEGFSFGGTTTTMLTLRYPEYFSCGIAGGGVYDWRLYDTHYTERYMDTPAANPEGYRIASPLNFVKGSKIAPGALKLTHGTGDDNVHFQNTLQLVDALQKEGIQFELMIYPDGMHGYRGLQHEHDKAADHIFWTRHLLGK